MGKCQYTLETSQTEVELPTKHFYTLFGAYKLMPHPRHHAEVGGKSTGT